MIGLHVGQLVFQAVDLHLQVGDGESQVVPDRSETSDVSLHVHAQVQLALVPAQEKPRVREVEENP